MAEPRIVNINGEIFSDSEAKISVFDRGFLYGDSLYEVIRTYEGKFCGIEDHMDRLLKSADLARMKLSQEVSVYVSEIKRTLERYRELPGTGENEVYCRLIITRGAGRIGFGLSCIDTPTQYVIILQPVPTVTVEQFNKGISLKISSYLRNDPRALNPAMKSGNYLNCLLATLEAHEQGFDDALLCNAQGFVTEGSTFNIFYVRKGVVATPPLEIGILDGITRRTVLRACELLDIPAREVYFPRERLYEADEVFATGTVKEVFPVFRVDQHNIGKTKAGKYTRAILEKMREIAKSAH